MRGKIGYHQRSHRPGGSDPIAGAIYYEYQNVGDWLYIEATANGGPNSNAIDLQASGGDFNINVADGYFNVDADTNIYLTSNVSGSQLSLTPTQGRLDGHAIGIGADTNDITMNAPDGKQLLFESASGTNKDRMVVKADGSLARFFIEAGGHVQVFDSGLNTIFQVDENGTLHGKTGAGPMVFDL